VVRLGVRLFVFVHGGQGRWVFENKLTPYPLLAFLRPELTHIMGGGISAPRKSSETWSSEELASFLVSLDGGKYSSYAEVAQAEGLTGMALLQMTAAAVSAALNCSEECHAAVILEELEKRRALQLTGEDDSLLDGQERKRENSPLVADVEQLVIGADDADRPRILIGRIRAEAEKGERGEVDFASWALSACTELSQGKHNNNQLQLHC
jgi:hypothetical protein